MNKKFVNGSQSIIVLYFLLVLSIILNVLFLSIYFFKIAPQNKILSEQVKTISSQKESKNCTKVYSQSMGKFVCLSKEEMESKSLSDCSRNFRETLGDNLDALKSLRDINDLDKLRDFSVKMCMQEKGHEYK